MSTWLDKSRTRQRKCPPILLLWFNSAEKVNKEPLDNLFSSSTIKSLYCKMSWCQQTHRPIVKCWLQKNFDCANKLKKNLQQDQISLVWNVRKQIWDGLSIVGSSHSLGKHHGNVNTLNFLTLPHVLVLWYGIGDNNSLEACTVDSVRRGL